MVTFAELLEKFRIQKQIRKKDLAEEAGLTAGYMSLLTRGERTSPSRKTVEALADALGLGEEDRRYFFAAAGHPESVFALKTPSLEEPERHFTKADWGEAPDMTIFYGRQDEQALLRQWVENERCRVVTVLGLGGIGKTSLASRLARSIYDSFAYVFWRSLQDTPLLENVLRECLQFITDQKSPALPRERGLAFLIEMLLDEMRARRCLLIFDNFESVLQQGKRAGQYREGYEGYGRLLRRVGEMDHQSSLLITSREKPREIVQLEGIDTPVRSLVLWGVTEIDSQELLRGKGIVGSSAAWADLVARYSGNPLALKLIAETIRELFGGDVDEFLKAESIIVGDMQALLDQQFQRLTELEKEIMYWLALEREPVTLVELQRNMLRRIFEGELLEALDSLRRRSIIETSGPGGFTLQPVIMEYVTQLFVQKICKEIDVEKPHLFESHALLKAQAKDYIRERQTRLILAPVAEHLLMTFGLEGTEQRFKSILEGLRRARAQTLGYSAGNILNLLISLGVDLSHADFSGLTVWQAYLQEVPLHDVNFAFTDLTSSVFTDTFDSVLSVAVSADGKYLAAGTAGSEIRLWNIEDGIPLGTFKGHTDWVRSVVINRQGTLLISVSEDRTLRLWDMHTQEMQAVLRGHRGRIYAVTLSPDEKYLASASEDRTIRLWDIASRQCLRVYREHTNRVWSVAFSPDNTLLASNSEDQTIRLWDVKTGRCLKILEEDASREGHLTRIWSVAFSPDGRLLVSGGEERSVLLWDVQTGERVKILRGHSHWIRSAVFSPDGKLLASGGDDATVRLWDVESGHCLKTLEGHVNRVRSLVFRPDSKVLITGGDDQTINLWEVATGRCLKKLHGNITRAWCVAFSPNGALLASTTEDRAVRVWDVSSGECLKVFYEHTNWARSVAFSPDSRLLASGGEDQVVRLWDVTSGQLLRTFHGHTYWIYAVAIDPTGSIIASCSEDQTICLWDIVTGQPTILQKGFDWVRSLAFSPSGEMLVSGGEDQVVRLWDVRTGCCLRTFEGHTDGITSVTMNSSGTLVASGSEDRTVRIWEVSSGRCLHILQKHHDYVRSVAFSPDGDVLASGGDDEVIYLWDIASETPLQILRGHVERVSSVAFSPRGDILASGGYDGTIKFWNRDDGQLLRTLSRRRPYEGMNIANTRGLTLAQKSTLRDLGAVEIQMPRNEY